jgi:hypothetical protein
MSPAPTSIPGISRRKIANKIKNTDLELIQNNETRIPG